MNAAKSRRRSSCSSGVEKGLKVQVVNNRCDTGVVLSCRGMTCCSGTAGAAAYGGGAGGGAAATDGYTRSRRAFPPVDMRGGPFGISKGISISRCTGMQYKS